MSTKAMPRQQKQLCEQRDAIRFPKQSFLYEASPMGFNAGDTNLYRYVKNDPTNSIDPSGRSLVLRWMETWLGVVVAVAPRSPKPTMPQGTPEFGRNQVKWGTGAAEATQRAKNITKVEAMQLDPNKVRQTRDWYRQVYRNNPANKTALERYKLMNRILELRVPIGYHGIL